MTNDDDIDAMLHVLRENYQSRLPAQLALLTEQWQDFRDAQDDAHFEALYMTVHNIAGNAGLFGFSAVGDLARDVDTLLQRSSTGVCGELRDKMLALQAQIEASQGRDVS